MGLISHGIAVGVGYYIAQPSGQRRLTQLRQRVVGLAHSPQVTQVQERGRGLVGDRAIAARTALTGRHATTDVPTNDVTTSDVTTADSTTTDTAGGDPVVDPSVPARGRRLRRQRNRKNRRPRPDPASSAGPDVQAQPSTGAAAAATSPTPDPSGRQAR